MSALRTTQSRKRGSDNECSSSSDSDEIHEPFKKHRIVSDEPNPVHRRMILFGDYFTSRVRDFFNWFQRLPVGSNNDKERVLKIGEDGLELEDDDDVETAIFLEEEFKRMSDNSNRRENSTRERNSVPVFIQNMTSTPVYRGHDGTRGRTLDSLLRQPDNGCNNGITNSRKYKRDGTITHRNVAPITNPSLDVELLWNTEEMPYEESDIQIVSEISNERSHEKLARQTSKEYKDTSPSSFIKGKAAYEKQRSLNKPSTAHEVIRLQEKQHYQLLLDKIVGTCKYHPIMPRKDPEPAEIKMDITDDDSPVVLGSFKRDVLEEPVNEFLQKYYKPCQFNPCSSPKDNSEIEMLTVEDVPAIETEESDDYYKYKPKLSPRPDILSSEWIIEFEKVITLETEQCLEMITKQEEKIKRYQKRRKDGILREKILRGYCISSDQSEKDEFPELTLDMCCRIEEAFKSTLPDLETLSTFKDSTCNHADIKTLYNKNWLNDSVINFYLSLIMERGKNHPVYPSVYAFNSYFYSSLKNRGSKAVMRWTRKIEDSKNIFQFDILFVPLHLGVHWALCVVDNRTKKIKYYDSMRSSDVQCLTILQKYLVVEKQEKLGIVMDLNAYSTEIVTDIPRQMNNYDCGMFTLKYAEYISRDAPITFSQHHMQYFRQRMAIEILDKRLF